MLPGRKASRPANLNRIVTGAVSIALALGLSVAASAGPPPQPKPKPVPEAEKVWLCKGPASKRYHFTKKCRGLANCSTPLEEVTLERAQELGRTLCGWED